MLMAASAPQGFGVGLSLADAMRSSLWAISWAMLASTRAGLMTTMAYTSALAECRSVEELASLQADAVQSMLRAAEACASEMAEATGRFLGDAEAAIKGTDAATADPAA
jgi:Phasin protein